jgi:hypothetical protein
MMWRWVIVIAILVLLFGSNVFHTVADIIGYINTMIITTFDWLGNLIHWSGIVSEFKK